MMPVRLVIRRVENGWILEQHQDGMSLIADPISHVATTPDQVATLAKLWATDEMIIGLTDLEITKAAWPDRAENAIINDDDGTTIGRWIYEGALHKGTERQYMAQMAAQRRQNGTGIPPHPMQLDEKEFMRQAGIETAEVFHEPKDDAGQVHVPDPELNVAKPLPEVEAEAAFNDEVRTELDGIDPPNGPVKLLGEDRTWRKTPRKRGVSDREREMRGEFAPRLSDEEI